MLQKKINIQNKKARFEFELIDQYTAGIVLTGTEIKSPILSPALLSDRYSKGRYSEITESDDIV